MLGFVDLLYGRIELPEWLLPFLRLPEFVRLREVRLSNVDSFYFKDFSGPTRWEHGVAVAALANRCSKRKGLSLRESAVLLLAALLHDVGTPPFAHTVEAVLADFDHELEGHRLLTGRHDGNRAPDTPIFESQLPQFGRACEKLSRLLKVRIDVDEVAGCILGEGDLGFLVNGSVDLDNADNVARASLFLGHEVSGRVPMGIADWLAEQDGVVADLGNVDNECVRAWIRYRERLYSEFFEAESAELGRMAFLQYLMRRAVAEGHLEREQLIRATDDGLMNAIRRSGEEKAGDFRSTLGELVQRYKLLEEPTRVATVSIEDEETLRALKHPSAVEWMTRRLRTERLDPMIIVMSRRFGGSRKTNLVAEAVGTLSLFELGSKTGERELRKGIEGEAGPGAKPQKEPAADLAVALTRAVNGWSVEKPWRTRSLPRQRAIAAALDGVGDWGFRLSRNDCFHPYPSTFVHAIPANLLVCLGLRGDVVLDPFGGTSQTAIEALKYGNDAIAADVNTIACLVAKARLTFVPRRTRERLGVLHEEEFMTGKPGEPPTMELLEEWFHPETLKELRHILGYVERRRDNVAKAILRACFSAILPLCTARRGEQHGYFADNCPLPSTVEQPPYRRAGRIFVERVRRALGGIERLYSVLERQGRKPERELARVSVRQVDVRTAVADSYGVAKGDVGAIVTSPPYLCMADYALGHRLSYEWLAPTMLQEDFRREIGARRLRLKDGRAEETMREYREQLDGFARLCGEVVRSTGFVAVVLGQPVAKRYKDAAVVDWFDGAMASAGFQRMWTKERTINWHRNHGYARLRKERVSVHVKE